MIRGLCNKCNSLIEIPEGVNAFECPNCHEQIFSETVAKNFAKTYNVYKRKAEIAMLGSTNYPEAYKNYELLLKLNETDVGALIALVIAKLYCSNLHNITIKDSTDLLLKYSDNISIGQDNVQILSEGLSRIRIDSRKITDSFKRYSNVSKYAYDLYKQSLNEYKFYLTSYLTIYDALIDVNKFFKDSKEIINEEINYVDNELKQEITLLSQSSEKHIFKDEKGNEIVNIFPNKAKLYKIRMGLYICMGLGALLTLVGLILLAVNVIPAIKFSFLGIGLVLFIGGYFVNHKLKSINYNLPY